MIKKIVSVIFWITSISIYSQVEVTGKVKDKEEGIPVPFANVVALDNTNAIVTGAITEEDGTFRFDVSTGEYKIRISFLGYEEWVKEIEVTEAMSLGDITLIKKAKDLDEVLIVTKKPLIERKTDRLVFNVEQSISASGGDALDALKLTPGLTVQDNSISILGKSGLGIMIDDKLLNLSGNDLTSFLNTIQSNDIKSVEVITTPPAKYDAQGNGGLINIILKKGKINSWSNSTSTSYEHIEMPVFSISNSFKYRKNKINALASINTRLGEQRYIQESEIFYDQNTWFIDNMQDRDLENFSGRLIFDYELTKMSSIGFQASGNISRPLWDFNTNTEIRNKSSQLDSILKSTGILDRERDNLSFNVHYNSKLDTLGKRISIDLDYFNYNKNDKRDIKADTYLNEESFVRTNFSEINDTDHTIDNYSVKVDMEHPLGFVNLSYGLKATYTKNTFKIYANNILEQNTTNDNFEYIENNQAAYVSGRKKLNDKWRFQIGLRLENIISEGDSKTLNVTTKNEYLELFPTFYLSHIPNENHSFSVNYSRRINRPYFAQLNPSISNVNGNIRSQGNPFLQPAFYNSFSIDYLYKGALSTSIYLDIETDKIGVVPIANNDTFEQEINFYNYYTLYEYGISMSYNKNIKPWWQSYNSVYFMNYKSKITNPVIVGENESDLSYYVSSNNTFSLNKEKTKNLEFRYWHSGPYVSGQTSYENSQALDIGYKMTVLNKKLQLSFNALDVFNTSPRKSTSVANNIKSTHIGYGLYRGRGFRVSVNYNFGNSNVKVKQRRFGNEEEKNRAN